MESSLNQRKSSPARKPPRHKRKSTITNKPIKVRYISNPVRVETCASKFRELVQELTGQDAVDLPTEPTTFTGEEDTNRSFELENPSPLDGGTREYYSPLDDEVVFGREMSVGLNGFLSNGFYNVNVVGSIGSL